MKFKLNANMARVAEAIEEPGRDYKKNEETRLRISKDLCTKLLESGLFEVDEEDLCTRTVWEATEGCLVSDVCAFFAEYIYKDKKHPIPSELFSDICNLVFIGDGGCPECGGELEFLEYDGHMENLHDYYTPPYLVVEGYIYRCRECGEEITLDEEL